MKISPDFKVVKVCFGQQPEFDVIFTNEFGVNYGIKNLPKITDLINRFIHTTLVSKLVYPKHLTFSLESLLDNVQQPQQTERSEERTGKKAEPASKKKRKLPEEGLRKGVDLKKKKRTDWKKMKQRMAEEETPLLDGGDQESFLEEQEDESDEQLELSSSDEEVNNDAKW